MRSSGGAESEAVAGRAEIDDAIDTILDLADQQYAFTADEDSGLAMNERAATLEPGDGFSACSTLDCQRLFAAL